MNEVTNSAMLDRYKANGKTETVMWLKSLHETPASDRAYYHIIENTVKTQAALRKSINKPGGQVKFDDFLIAPIKIPQLTPSKQKPKNVDLPCSCGFKNTASQLSVKLCEVENELKEKCAEIKELKKSRLTKHGLAKIKKTIQTLKNNIKLLTRRLNIKTRQLKSIRVMHCRQRKHNHKLRSTINKLNVNINTSESQCNEVTEMQKLIEDKDKIICEVTDSNHYLQTLLEDSDSHTVSCYIEGKYTAELRQCIYDMLSCNVGSRNVAPVIKTVLKLVSKTVDQLPSQTCILNMNIERLALAQAQICEQTSSQNTCLYTDETSKKGTKYCGYHLSDSDGNMIVLGLRQLLTKSAKDTLTTFQEILNDIDNQCLDATENSSKQILANITATMSDRAATELKFNTLLEQLRIEILPDVRDNWAQLNGEEQLATGRLFNFFCGLHSLIHFAEVASSALLETEKAFFPDSPPVYDRSFGGHTECGPLRLVRTCSKALARGADEKSGQYKQFSLYVQPFLKENNMHSLPLEPFHGNRFNILFENAASVFFLHTHIQQFLMGNQSNNLLKSVLHDLNVVEYLAGVKALGLISRLVTCPLWCLLEDKSVHILDMNVHYSNLLIFFNTVNEHIDEFMTGDFLPFGDNTAVKRDPITQILCAAWLHDDLVQVQLMIIFPALCTLSQKIFKDHLPGGEWAEYSDTMKEKCTGVQKHNKFAESVFGMLDNMLRRNPNMSVLSAEAYIMFAHNKTTNWLAGKTDEQRRDIVQRSTRKRVSLRKQFQKRKLEISQKQRESVQQKIIEAQEKERRRLNKIEKYTSDMLYYGLWQSEERVDTAIMEMTSKTEKVKGLKVQMNFRKHVLRQACEPKDLYLFSKKVDGKTVQCDVEELSAKVKILIQHSFTASTTTTPTQDTGLPLLTGKAVKHRQISGTEPVWYKGTVISQVPGYREWYNIVYEGDEAVYSYKLAEDWKAGDLELV